MDIEMDLRELLVLRDPGVRFTDRVMSRVGDAPMIRQPEGVVQIADARARKRSRIVLIATVVAVAAAAAAIPLMLQDELVPPAVRDAAAPPASVQPEAPGDSGRPLHVVSDQTGETLNPLDCMDPDVVRGLLLQGAFNPTFSLAADLPPEMSAFKAPRQFTLIGSTVRAPVISQVQTSVAVVFRSSLAPDAARAAGVQALAASGWNQNSSSAFRIMDVFRSSNTTVAAETWCREGKPVSISASAIDGVTYVILSASRDVNGSANSRNACEQPPQPARVASALDQHMPTLELPRDPATGKQVAMRGGGGSSGPVKRSVSAGFTTTDSIANVAQHFAQQMAEQGWSRESGWAGAATAGSTWSRQMDSDTVLQGRLMVSAFDRGRFTAVFNVVQTK